MPRQKDMFAKRRVKWFNIRVDEYTYSLYERIIDCGKAMSLVDAARRAASFFLGIPLKSDEQLRFERMADFVDGLSTQIKREDAEA